MAAGNQGGFAVLADGSVMEWGCDAAKTGGFITETPTKVPGVSDVVAVAANTEAAYALTSTGKVWSWGASPDGEAGQGDSRTGWHNPKLMNLPAVRTISDEAAVTTDGHVYTWGGNGSGELGVHKPDRSNSPIEAPGLARVAGLATNTAWGPLTHVVITNGD